MKELLIPKQSDTVEGLIGSSLQRCADMKQDTFDTRLPEVLREMKEHARENVSGHTLLIRESAPYYYSCLTETLSENNALLFYVSRDFELYGRYGNQELKEELRELNFRIGTNVAESIIGTNAVSVASKCAESVWTVGEQNYAKALKPYALYAFTIHGKYNRMVYVLLITRHDKLTPAIVSLFKLIESVESLTSSGYLTEDMILKDAFISANYGSNKTDNFLILIGSGGKITYTNDVFYQLFKNTYREVINMPLNLVVPELSYIVDSMRDNGPPPAPKKISFSAMPDVEYIVTCTKANLQMANSGIAVTAQRIIHEHSAAAKGEGGAKYSFDDIIGFSERFTQLKLYGAKVAKTNCTVLIRGESGTGKELFAHALHNASDRRDKPFISINCAAIPKDLIGSELFGYVGGAFTGANRSGAKGKFELADGGTLFLDEIGEMPLEMQSVLLRVLEEDCVTRIGGSRPIPVDVRLVVATNQNLEEYIRQGKFRLDLFYRLNIISLKTIPLRERKDDINATADYFVAMFSHVYNKECNGISFTAREALREYDWPGNVRELRNAIERAIISSESKFIELRDFPPEISNNNNKFYTAAYSGRSPAAFADEAPQKMIAYTDSRIETAIDLMKKYDGNKSKVAKKMGIARTTLYRILKKANIN